MKAPVNTKTRKPENAKTGGINLWTRKRRKRENGENAKTAKTAKTGKTRKRENGENPKTRKRRKRRKPENGQNCSCFLVFNFSFSGFLGFLGFLVFSFSGFLVPLAAPFWPGRVFYVLRKRRGSLKLVLNRWHSPSSRPQGEGTPCLLEPAAISVIFYFSLNIGCNIHNVEGKHLSTHAKMIGRSTV